MHDGIGLASFNKQNNNKETIQEIKANIADINKQLNELPLMLEKTQNGTKQEHNVDIQELTKNIRNLNDFIDTLD